VKTPEQGFDANLVCLNGYIVRSPQTRETPAGIPISRFTLEHVSQQQEAGLPRQVQLRISVIVAGKDLQPKLQGFKEGSAVQVKGFLNKSVFRGQEIKLVIHANELKLME